jgi:hypothetical protein
MGNAGGCNATADEQTCNSSLNYNMFENAKKIKKDSVIDANDKNLATLRSNWIIASGATVKETKLVPIICCQSIIYGDIDARDVNVDNDQRCDN